MSLPIITLTSSSNTSISQTSPSVNSKNFREPSFSSYLNGAEETFVLKLRGTSTRGLNSSVFIPHDHILPGESSKENAEIDVFDAEKYFSESFNHRPDIVTKSLPSHQLKKDDPAEVFARKDQPRTATPSVHSESSWNSRQGLLPRNQQQPRRINKKSFLASIGRSCSCNDKNSVNISVFNGKNCSGKSANTRLVNGKSRQGDESCDHLANKFDELKVGVNSDGHFSFPVFNPKTENQAGKKSLQVFGSSVLGNGKNCLSLEKKLTMMTWDAVAPGAAKIPSISHEIYNDSDSDESSDLFEIESLSKCSIQASDSLSGCITPTSCYAPSEASIDWSVITASAADFSTLSDSEDLRSTAARKVSLNSKNVPLKETPRQRSSVLSGCKSQKAVRVAGDAHRSNEKGFSNGRRHLRLESFIPMTRFNDKSKQACFDSRNR